MAKPKISNPIDVHVSSRLRVRRLMLNLSQEKLGKALGITFQQVQKYEKGVNRMGSSRLQQAADILGVRFFFEGATAVLTSQTAVLSSQPTSMNSSPAKMG
jgi:transcriptional regulator with XRE-family HTH domain